MTLSTLVVIFALEYVCSIRLRRGSTRMKDNNGISKYWQRAMNFLLRLFYLMYLEVVLSCFIDFALAKTENRRYTGNVVLSVIVIMCAIVFFLFILSRGCGKNDPFMTDVYEGTITFKTFFLLNNIVNFHVVNHTSLLSE